MRFSKARELTYLKLEILKMNIEEFLIEIGAGLYSLADLRNLLITIINNKNVKVKIFKIEYLKYKINEYKRLSKTLKK